MFRAQTRSNSIAKSWKLIDSKKVTIVSIEKPSTFTVCHNIFTMRFGSTSATFINVKVSLPKLSAAFNKIEAKFPMQLTLYVNNVVLGQLPFWFYVCFTVAFLSLSVPPLPRAASRFVALPRMASSHQKVSICLICCCSCCCCCCCCSICCSCCCCSIWQQSFMPCRTHRKRRSPNPQPAAHSPDHEHG